MDINCCKFTDPKCICFTSWFCLTILFYMNHMMKVKILQLTKLEGFLFKWKNHFQGRNIFVFLGALEMVENEDQLSILIAHEMAHVILQHAVRNFKYS